MTCCLLQSKNKQLNQTPSLVQKGKRRRFCVEKQKRKISDESLVYQFDRNLCNKKSINIFKFWENGYIIRPTETHIRKIRRKGGEQTWTGM